VAQHIFTTTAQGDTLTVDGTVTRRAHAGIGAFVAAAVTTLRKAALEPGMPRMSSEWLLSHDKYTGNRWTN
jgi:hypothetical protein